MKIPDYEIVLREQCDGYVRQIIRFKNGTTVDMRIPEHTSDESEKLSGQITKACFELVFPDEDWDGKSLYVIT